MQAFHYVPSVIPASLHNVDFFKPVLSNIGHEHPPCAVIKGKSPGIAEPKRPYLRQSSAANKRIVGRNAIRQPRTVAVHVYAKHLAQQRLRILTMAEWITGASSISQSKVKKPVWPKSELPGFVVREIADLIYRKQDSFARRICLIWVRHRRQIFRDD